MDEVHAVTCFLRNRGEVLLLRDPGDAHGDSWGAITGHGDEDFDALAREEVRTATGLDDGVEFVRAGDPFAVTDRARGARWVIHPYLFDAETRELPGAGAFEPVWVSPPEILRRDTDSDLWTTWQRVGPSVETVATDDQHGASWLSLRALEVLRDRAAVTTGDDAWATLTAVAEDLLDARPSMQVVANRINRAMAAAGSDRTADAVEHAAREVIDAACDADAKAAGQAADVAEGRILTLSRSGTVADALGRADLDTLYALESRPGREGVGVAESFADGTRVTLVTDAAAAHLLATEPIDAVLVGADTVRRDGSVVNKVGTRGVAVAAAREDVPVYVVCARDKVATAEDGPHLEPGDPERVYAGDADLDVLNPTFDVTPADLLEGIVTEAGTLATEEVPAVADDLAKMADWRD